MLLMCMLVHTCMHAYMHMHVHPCVFGIWMRTRTCMQRHMHNHMFRASGGVTYIHAYMHAHSHVQCISDLMLATLCCTIIRCIQTRVECRIRECPNTAMLTSDWPFNPQLCCCRAGWPRRPNLGVVCLNIHTSTHRGRLPMHLNAHTNNAGPSDRNSNTTAKSARRLQHT